MKKIARLIFSYALCLLWTPAFGLDKPTKPSFEFTDVVYAKIGDRALHMDIAVPEDGIKNSHPAVVWIPMVADGRPAPIK